MLRNNMLPKNFSPKKGKGVSMLRKKHGKKHQKRGSISTGMTDGQISKTDLSRFKMGGQLSPEYPVKRHNLLMVVIIPAMTVIIAQTTVEAER